MSASTQQQIRLKASDSAASVRRSSGPQARCAAGEVLQPGASRSPWWLGGGFFAPTRLRNLNRLHPVMLCAPCSLPVHRAVRRRVVLSRIGRR